MHANSLMLKDRRNGQGIYKYPRFSKSINHLMASEHKFEDGGYDVDLIIYTRSEINNLATISFKSQYLFSEWILYHCKLVYSLKQFNQLHNNMMSMYIIIIVIILLTHSAPIQSIVVVK